MYFSILGKPTNKDLERYPAVHFTGPHEWDPSALGYQTLQVQNHLEMPGVLVQLDHIQHT